MGQIAREATDFVQQRKLVTVPPLCEETWRLTMMSPEAPEDDTLCGLRRAADDGGLCPAEHEPGRQAHGHAGQQPPLHAAGNSARADPRPSPARVLRGSLQHAPRLFATAFYVEGWAFYWELRLWDLGWAKTPEDRIGMLFWRMTRAAADHRQPEVPPRPHETRGNGRLSDRSRGTREIRRHRRGAALHQAEPLYQVGYMVGGRQILRPAQGAGRRRQDVPSSSSTTPCSRKGPCPSSCFAARVGLPLRADAKPCWRFHESK